LLAFYKNNNKDFGFVCEKKFTAKKTYFLRGLKTIGLLFIPIKSRFYKRLVI